MQILANSILISYVICISLISVYCSIQLYFLFLYNRNHKTQREHITTPDLSSHNLPFVTIQLPIFNEQYVVVRLIDQIVKINYPKEKLQIQVLDDSTDSTLDITKSKVEYYKNLGFDIELIHRVDRTGYKAGALKNGLLYSKGEFIAIFDADFLPDESFLIKCLPYFDDPKTGVVQTRWEHINQNYNLLTRLQAVQLNVHFTIEQTARMEGQYFLQFNGTAGIWRKTAILDAGGWQTDTLTEDLDLSIRAQLKDWTIKYLEDVGSASELPVEMNGLKSQQFRWMKGGAECARKLLPVVWKSKLGFTKKIHTTFHLLSSSIFLLIFITGLQTIPILLMFKYYNGNLKWLGIFLVSWVMIFFVYHKANFNPIVRKNYSTKDIMVFALMFPVLLSLSMGLSLHNAIAVWQGLRGKKSAFIRTPKYNIINKNDLFSSTTYVAKKMPFSTRLEFLMAFFYLLGIVIGISTGNNTYILIHLMLFVGFATIATLSWRHLLKTN